MALLSIAALALAMTGVLYAHWTETLEVSGTVQAGSIDVNWTALETNDDDIDGPWFYDGELEALAYSGPDGDGTADPAGPCLNLGGTCPNQGDIPFYDKDVAGCYAVFDADTDAMTITVENTYPSYWCSIFANILVEGTVPVKVAGVSMTATLDGDPVTVSPDGAGGFVIDAPATPFEGSPADVIQGEFKLEQFACGAQLHPNDPDTWDGYFHVDQGAKQGGLYEFTLTMDFVNYNEWDPSMCTGIAP